MSFRKSTILDGGDKALRALEVVVKKFAVGKSAAGFTEENLHLRIA